MSEDVKYQLNVLIADNTITPDDPDDKIFVIVSNGTADQDRIITEMMLVNPGLERETLQHVFKLEHRITRRLLMSGMRVNNGLYDACLACRGLVHGASWDPNSNVLYVNFQQGKELREAISNTVINVIGEKGDVMYIASSIDAETGAEGFVATSGSNFTLLGKNIKIAGDDPSVGITLTDSEGTETKIKGGLIGVNQPSKLVFFIPAGLDDGVYTLKVTTQYSSGAQMLKTPRSIVRTLTIGDVTEPDTPVTGGDDEEDGPQVQ